LLFRMPEIRFSRLRFPGSQPVSGSLPIDP
jgi:hypothetical protein